ncbi:CHAT domain-containing protein [Actinoplanes sp. CA-142083]|uniref:CHAT domain-containing protein n=1 Tax=Actinoplanes sp. CA-142083 TaxID=3239903 RepID=UPI003D89F3BC
MATRKTSGAATRSRSRADRVAALYAAGVAANQDARPALAVRRLRAGLHLIDEMPGQVDPGAHGRLLVSLAWAEAERGDVALGFRLVDRAEATLPVPLKPIARAQRALLLTRNGQAGAALSEFTAAIGGLGDPHDLVKTLTNRAVLHLEVGRIGAAREDLDRALRLADRHGLDAAAARALLNLGCLEGVAGDLPGALRTLTVARTAFERVGLATILSVVALEQARVLIGAGLFREADRELDAAMRQAHRERQGHTYADALQLRAAAALLAGRPVDAAEWARQARKAFLARRNRRQAALCALLELRASAHREDLAGRLRRLAAELRDLDLPEDARVAALLAERCRLRGATAGRERPLRGAVAGRERARPADGPPGRFDGPPGRFDRLDTRLLWRLTRAELAQAAGRPAEAARHLRAGMAALHRHRAHLGSFDLQTGVAAHGREIAAAGLASALAGGSLSAVYRWSERVRAQSSLLLPVRPPDDPEAAALLEELRHSRFVLREAELAGRPIRELHTRVERLHRLVRERSWSSPGSNGRNGSAPAPLGAVRAALGDAALVAYLRDGDALSALVVTAGRTTLTALGSAARAEQAVLRLRADLDTRAGRAMSGRLARAVALATRHDAAALAGMILDPLLRRTGDRDLVVVPTGLLTTAPWGLLPACRQRPVTVALSATAWLAAVRRVPPPGPAAPAFVAGPGIPRGEQEIRSVAALYPGARVLTGAAATPRAALGALDGAGVAHLAAHGRHQAENALFSTLDLAGGQILGYDLLGLRRPPALVVLSCCELGLTDIRPGDESFGIASALLSGGAATVVASVSRVGEEEAAALMTGFHRALTAGRTPAAALAEASPAGFVCLGS